MKQENTQMERYKDGQDKIINKQMNIYRIIAYFTIYTIAGYIIETIFALLVYGKLESRQGFLYGPFCPIYGVGAVIMILILSKLKNNVHKLFISGFFVGGAIEYLISFFGEYVMNVKWWDYSDKFLNINGRICVSYCFFWGVLSVYLIKVLNPQVDKLIDKIKSKFDINYLKKITIITAIIMIIDTIITTLAVNAFTARTIVENNLEAKNQVLYESIYNHYHENKTIRDFVDKYWNEYLIIKIFPNLKITLADDTDVLARSYYKHVKPYYLKLR